MKIVKSNEIKKTIFNEIDIGCVFITKEDKDLVLMKIQTGMNEYGFKTNAICLEFGSLFMFEEDTEVVILDCELIVHTKEI